MPTHPMLHLLLMLASCWSTALAHAHGGVVEEDDLCVINIGYLKAHFKIYLPQHTGHREYCEDIPVNGESVFVMEYQHDGLSQAEIEFRIIRNTTGKGIFARLADVEALPDIDAVTVRHAAPAVVPDVYTLLQNFDDDGEYIGIVAARQTDTGKRYTAVFPFEVGYTGFGVWPWIVATLIVLQLNFWLLRRKHQTPQAPGKLTAAVAILCTQLALPSDAEEKSFYTSDAGHFTVTVAPDIDPPAINRIHGWDLAVSHASGEPAAKAEISIDGGMPDHDHGLPTKPVIRPSDRPGHYRIEGLRFHMQGYWRLRLSIFDGQRRDDVTIELDLT